MKNTSAQNGYGLKKFGYINNFSAQLAQLNHLLQGTGQTLKSYEVDSIVDPLVATNLNSYGCNNFHGAPIDDEHAAYKVINTGLKTISGEDIVGLFTRNKKRYTYEGVTVTDAQVKDEFDIRVASQKESYDANPAAYASAEKNGSDLYYMPAGYRGVKNLLIQLSDEKQAEIKQLNSDLTTAKNLLSSGNDDLEELKAQDTAELDEEALAAYNEQIAALEEQVASAQTTIDETQAKIDETTEAAFAEILPLAQEVLAKAQAGEDFDALIETYGEDAGMTAEPNKSRGYLVCDGLSIYEQSFQDAAMALENVGDVSAELVKTSYGFHILQYASELAGGEVEYTEEIKTAIYDEMLKEAQDAAYEAAVTQWVSEAKVETFPKVMK